MVKKALGVLVFGWILFGFGVASAQAVSDYDLKTNYEVLEDNKISVDYIYEAVATGDPPLTKVDLSVVGEQFEGLKVKLTDGRDVPAAYNNSTKKLEINLSGFPRPKNYKWSFAVSYKTNIPSGFGDITAFLLSCFATGRNKSKV